MSRIKKFLREIARSNIDYVLDAISWRLSNWLFYYYHSYLISTDKPKLVVRTYASYFKRFASTNDLPLLKKCGLSESFAREHLNAGDRCVIMGQNDEIMSIIWGCSERRWGDPRQRRKPRQWRARQRRKGPVFTPPRAGVQVRAHAHRTCHPPGAGARSRHRPIGPGNGEESEQGPLDARQTYA